MTNTTTVSPQQLQPPPPPQQQQQHQQQAAPPEVNAQNHQYYEFQWRMLTLCAEFYSAAEELLVRFRTLRVIKQRRLTRFDNVEKHSSPRSSSMLSNGSIRKSRPPQSLI
jgi:hypothetical protein